MTATERKHRTTETVTYHRRLHDDLLEYLEENHPVGSWEIVTKERTKSGYLGVWRFVICSTRMALVVRAYTSGWEARHARTAGRDA